MKGRQFGFELGALLHDFLRSNADRAARHDVGSHPVLIASNASWLVCRASPCLRHLSAECAVFVSAARSRSESSFQRASSLKKRMFAEIVLFLFPDPGLSTTSGRPPARAGGAHSPEFKGQARNLQDRQILQIELF